MKFIIEDDIYGSIDSAIDAVETILRDGEYYDTEMFDDEIDGEYGNIEIGGRRYYASNIVMNTEEDRYWEMFEEYKDNWINNELDSLRDRLIDAEENEDIYYNDINIRKIEDESETNDPTPKFTHLNNLNSFYAQIIGD